MRTVAILNPAAGGGRGARRAEALLARIPGIDVRRTDGPGHAIELARQARGDADVVVSVGGDGTLFEVVNGLLPAEPDGNRPALGILAVGTGNSFVRDVGLADPEAAVGALLADRGPGTRRRIDAARITHADGELYSINLVSLGFSADAGDLTNRRFKGLGVVGYVSAVLASVVRLRHRAFPHSVDGGGFDARPVTLLSFCNSRYTGGAMMMAPDADPGDGQLDVVRIGPMHRRRFLGSFPRIFRGTHPRMPEVQVGRARQVTFAPVGPVPAMIDGEIRALDLRGIEVVAGALEVIA